MLRIWATSTTNWDIIIKTEYNSAFLVNKVFIISLYCYNKLLNYIYRVNRFYEWFIKHIFYIFKKHLNKTKLYKLFVYTKFTNLRYSVFNGRNYSIYSHAFLLRKLNIFVKSKFKNISYYYLSLKFLCSLAYTKQQYISYLFICGPRVISFLDTYKYWNELPWSKLLTINLSFNLPLSSSLYKRKQSIKKRLKKRLIKFELYKV